MNDILMLGRIDSGRIELKRDAVDFRAFCKQLIDAVRSSEDQERLDRNLNFELRFAPLADVLKLNSDHFEAQRVGEGRTPKQAKADVELFLNLLRDLDRLSTSTSAHEDGFKLRISGKTQTEED